MISEVKTRGGTLYSLYLPDHDSDHIQRQIAVTGHPYEEPLLESMLARSEEGDLILDIGANIGNHTLFLAHHGRLVMAFEPNVRLVDAIKKSVSLNSYENRVEIVNAAIGAKAGRGAMNFPEAGNLGMGRVVEGSGDVEIITLETRSIDRPIKAIKIDVEGMEGAVLQGARKIIHAHRPDLYIEIAEKSSLAAIINEGYLEGYFYVSTFNHTPTHLFVHKSRFAADTTCIPVADETIFEIAGMNKTILSLRNKQQQVSKELDETNQALVKTIEMKNELEVQRAQLRSEHAYFEMKLKKYRVRYKTALIFSLILGAPLIILLSPLIVPVLAVNFIRKKLWGKRRAVRAPAVMKAPMEPAELDVQYSAPLKSIPDPNLDEPLISIIIPSFNREDFLVRAIRSVQAQTHSNTEIIVVDDGSNDGSVSIATHIAQQDPRVKVVSTLRNFGCYYARNVGVMHATGSFIGICDSDDILAPDRLERQVAKLQSDPNLKACLGRLRRWTEDFKQPASDLRYGENSLLWDRSLLREIGWYDTCRFGADSEFRERIIAKHGRKAIAYIPEEVYFLRSTKGSLALSDETSTYKLKDDKLEKWLSPQRVAYQKNFQAWHASMNDSASITFPQLKRPFELGSPEQNGSPSLGQRCVGAMASFPKRRDSLRLTLLTVLPQLDELILYLNDYEEIPDFCVHPKLRVILGKDTLGDLRDNGKFFDLPKENDSYVFTLDDDILYPPDYIQRLVHYIEIFNRKVIVGVHGVNFPETALSDLGQRTVYGFRHQHFGTFVDLLGTGTTGWHSSLLKPKLEDFQTAGVCDLWFARLAATSGLALFNVPREKGWLQPIEGNDETLFAEATKNPLFFFEVYEEYLAPLLKTHRLREKALARLHESHRPQTIKAALGQYSIR